MGRPVYVFSPPYDINSGGAIWLHRLCHLLNQVGADSRLIPSFPVYRISRLDIKRPFLKSVESWFKVKRNKYTKPFKTNPVFETPVAYINSSDEIADEAIVIYPEITPGNPLGARNIVRYFLHKPGYLTGIVEYGRGEYHIRGGTVSDGYRFPDNHMHEKYLDLTSIPWSIYEPSTELIERKGIAYCLRKGKGKKIIHDLQGSTCIDGLSHEDIAAHFRKVETFISYDPNTAYSVFASISGCDSVIVPDAGVSEEEWRPNPLDRYGLAYGFEGLGKARQTRLALIERLKEKETQQLESVRELYSAMCSYFSNSM